MIIPSRATKFHLPFVLHSGTHREGLRPSLPRITSQYHFCQCRPRTRSSTRKTQRDAQHSPSKMGDALPAEIDTKFGQNFYATFPASIPRALGQLLTSVTAVSTGCSSSCLVSASTLSGNTGLVVSWETQFYYTHQRYLYYYYLFGAFRWYRH